MDAGLFGGTFNPIHNGHISIARHVQQTFHLDTIYFIPSATPPHKPDIDLAPAQDRFKMVTDSLATVPGCRASDMELTRSGPSFTIDTLHAFSTRYGLDVRFFLLMGSDAFFDMPAWKDHRAIFQAVPIIVMIRGKTVPGERMTAEFLRHHVSKGYTWHPAEHCFRHRRLPPVYLCRVPKIDISSTMIRERVRRRQPISQWVPAPVAQTIIQKDLYL